MATAKKAITFYASAEVLDWYNSLPDGEGSRSINELLLKAIKYESEDRGNAKDIQLKIDNLADSHKELKNENDRLGKAMSKLQRLLLAIEARIDAQADTQIPTKESIKLVDALGGIADQEEIAEPEIDFFGEVDEKPALDLFGEFVQAHDYAPPPALQQSSPICPHGFNQSDCLSCFWVYQLSK